MIGFRRKKKGAASIRGRMCWCWLVRVATCSVALAQNPTLQNGSQS